MKSIPSKRERKVVVIIPALNEEKTVGGIITSIPRTPLPFTKTSVIIIDDGSTDNTYEVAHSANADFILKHKQNQGVASAIKDGIDVALKMNPDVICTIDADGQFDVREIPRVIKPVLENKADLVIGSRFHKGNKLKHMPFLKIIGNRIIAKVISKIIRTEIADAESGFRALSRQAAEELELIGYFTFTHDMILDVWFQGLRIQEVPVSVTYFPDRESRAVKNVTKYSFGILGVILIKFLRIIAAVLTGHDLKRKD
ncbi:MAG: glycosyltransferase [Candidatus Lokiarchaeota archaeon]|nr:glycosyltransferase [Candidatus Lokiarchaeota archaeon]